MEIRGDKRQSTDDKSTTDKDDESIEGEEEVEEEDSDKPTPSSTNTKEVQIALGLGNPSITYPIRYKAAAGTGSARSTEERLTFKCWFCPTVMYDMPDYERHTKCHQKSYRYKCDQCSWSTKFPYTLPSHKRCHTEKYFSQRPVIRRAMPWKWKFPKKRRPKLCVSRKKKSCKRRGGGGVKVKASRVQSKTTITVTGSSQLTGSRIRPAAGVTGGTGGGGRKNQPRFSCQDLACPAKFYTKIDLELHFKNLHNPLYGPYECHLCTYNSRLHYHLEEHLLKHTEDKKTGRNGDPHQRPNSSTSPSRNQRRISRISPSRRVRSDHRAYRPSWFKLANSKQRLSSISKKALLLAKWGRFDQLTPEKQHVIKTGNPKFVYPRQQVFSTGLVKVANFRCYHCPSAFNSFQSYCYHQCNHKELEVEAAAAAKVATTPTSSSTSTPPPHAHGGLQAFAGLKIRGEIEEYDVSFPSTSSSSRRRSPERWGQQQQQRELQRDAAGKNVMRVPKVEKEEEGFPIIVMTRGNNGKDSVVIKSEPNVNVKQEANEEIPSNNKNITYLISKVELYNFLYFDDPYIYQPNDGIHNLSLLQGDFTCGKTTCIVGCLLGLGYDLRLELSEKDTLCGIILGNVLMYGKTEGWIDITFNLKSYPGLYARFGAQLTLRRRFFVGLPLAASEFEISYQNIKGEKITRGAVTGIWNKLIPAFILRLVVLNPENLQYLDDNFSTVNEIFLELVELRVNCKKKAEVVLERFQRDLESRILRIKQLEGNIVKLIGDVQIDEYLKVIQKTQLEELDDSKEWYDVMEAKYQQILEDNSIAAGPDDDPQLELVCEMRTPFREYLRLQDYVGDIILDHSRNELVIWLKPSPPTAARAEEPFQHINPDEAREIWKSLPTPARELGLVGLYFSFWKVLGYICPIILSDGYSSSEDLEFQLKPAALRMFFKTVRQQPHRQILLSAPGVGPQDFLDSFSSNEGFVAFLRG